MIDHANKAWISEGNRRMRRERNFRRIASGVWWVLGLLIGALAGYNVAITHTATPQISYSQHRMLTTAGYCVKYQGCKVCEKRGRDGRVLYSTMAC